jgi:hypothetical protein
MAMIMIRIEIVKISNLTNKRYIGNTSKDLRKIKISNNLMMINIFYD